MTTRHSSRSRKAPLVQRALLVLTLLSIAFPTFAQVGSEWNNVDAAGILAVGDLADEPGLEAVVTDDVGMLSIINLDRGALIDQMPPPFALSSAVDIYFVRDVDADGIGELVVSGGGMLPNPTRLGLIDVDREIASLVWDVTDIVRGAIEFVDLSVANSTAIVTWDTVQLLIIRSQDGTILYDSLASNPGYLISSVLIEDFDADGREEVLIQFIDVGNVLSRLDLIGDESGASSVASSGVSSQTLWQSTPNPMGGSTTIVFSLDKPGRVLLRVYDASGRRVRTLIDEMTAAGRYSRIWDGRDDRGTEVGNGVYFYELDVNGVRSQRKIVRVK